MKLPILAFAMAVIIANNAFAAAYHYSAYIFSSQSGPYFPNPAAEGVGDPEVCKSLFIIPKQYDGHYTAVPTNATVFGVVAVTDGKTSKVFPLFTWTDGGLKTHFGCNGPLPIYAQLADSKEALIKTIVNAIKNK